MGPNFSKRPNNNNRQRRDNREAPQGKKGGYFEFRFMTDQEHERFRQRLIDSGLIKPNAAPTGIEKQSFYGPNGEKETRDVVVVYKSKEESAALRQSLIDKGLLIPKALTKRRFQNGSRQGNA